jgi:hypothetical protein
MKCSLFKNSFLILIALILFFEINTSAADYGYTLGDDGVCAVWWAEGTYKIMQQDPLPNGKIRPILIYSAGNEYESVQIVLHPHKSLNNFQIITQDLRSESGSILSSGQITVRIVEYIEVIRPTDSYGKPGWYPDQLPVLDKPPDLQEGRNHPFYITVHVPKETSPGNYNGSIQLMADGWEKVIPVELQVWNFTLPDKTSVRSAFGISTENIRNYHNLKSDEELKNVTDKYYAALRDYKIGPTNPFSLHPMDVIVDGLNWTGGVFTDETVHSGSKALKIIDNDVEVNIEAHTNALIEVDPSENYLLTWYVKTAEPDQKYCVFLQCYDGDRQVLPFENRLEEFTGQDRWDADTLKIRPFREAIRYVTIHLFPVFRSNSGSDTGIAWFDDVVFAQSSIGENLVFQGGFEVDPEDLDLNVDFTEFDKAGKRYLDAFGFNAYHLPLQGLPSGSFYQQRRGIFQGFAQGTAEYDYLMKKYLTIVQDHLEEMGWLGKDYVYWFDEPNTENYPFVREGMEIIHRAAPKITRFITEHQPGPDIMDVTEISCTVIGQLDPEIIKDLVAQGREFWSYVCCCPKAPYLSLFIDHDAINMRMWLWLSYKFQMKGILVWSANYWNSRTASPENYLQNPWEDPMSYTVGYGLPYGKQNGWGNGDGRFLYPPNRNPDDHSKKYMDGPIPCIRLENIRDGIEDYEYLLLLEKAIGNNEGKQKKRIREAQQLLAIPESLVAGPINYNKDPQSLIQYRMKIGKLLDEINSKQ